jgi:hypothetical protein
VCDVIFGNCTGEIWVRNTSPASRTQRSLEQDSSCWNSRLQLNRDDFQAGFPSPPRSTMRTRGRLPSPPPTPKHQHQSQLKEAVKQPTKKKLNQDASELTRVIEARVKHILPMPNEEITRCSASKGHRLRNRQIYTGAHKRKLTALYWHDVVSDTCIPIFIELAEFNPLVLGGPWKVQICEGIARRLSV